MKSHRITLSAILVLVVLAAGCDAGGDDGPTDKDLAFEKLAGEWDFGSNGGVILDGEDVSINYVGFSLSFAEETYQTQNAGALFEATGTWEWADEAARKILLDTGEEVTIVNLTETHFEFSFTHASDRGVAVGLSGSYEINLGK